MNILQAALAYSERGFSVIPIKTDKKPYLAWTDFQKRKATADEIRRWWQKWPGAMIGIVTGEISNLFVVDCDTQTGYEAIQKLLPDALISPIARTPRGGWHLWFLFPTGSKITIGAGVMPGVDIRGEGGYIVAPPSVNETGKAYTWQEGLSLIDVAPASVPRELMSVINNKLVLYKGGVDTSVDSCEFFTEGQRDDDLFSIANALVRNNLPAKLIQQTIEIIAANCTPPFPLEEAREKIRSAKARAERLDRTLSADVREWVLSTTGVFLSTDIYSCLQLSTREERKNVSIILKRLSVEKIIEKYGNKNGQYRCLDSDIEPLDWRNAGTAPLSLHWPFGIQSLVHLYPGNIAVIAGAPNAGKTSFILNFIKLNQQDHKIHLFSSEGGKEELKMRLSKFDIPLDAWNFSAWERSGDFADIIRPNDINVIDYLEIHDEFYKIGGILKAISDRLKDGFCLVALQKNTGRDEGLGGARGLEKPRLYLSMDNGRLKIVKAKSWVDGANNPNGLILDFKIIGGCKFHAAEGWGKER